MPRITGCEVLVVTKSVKNSRCPIHATFTVTGTSIAALSSKCTVQVRMTVDPIGRTGLGVLLNIVTEIGAGTGYGDKFNNTVGCDNS